MNKTLAMLTVAAILTPVGLFAQQAETTDSAKTEANAGYHSQDNAGMTTRKHHKHHKKTMTTDSTMSTSGTGTSSTTSTTSQTTTTNP